jgi:hypothetical protein
MKAFMRYDIGPVGLGMVVSADETTAHVGEKEEATFLTGQFRLFLEAFF